MLFTLTRPGVYLQQIALKDFVVILLSRGPVKFLINNLFNPQGSLHSSVQTPIVEEINIVLSLYKSSFSALQIKNSNSFISWSVSWVQAIELMNSASIMIFVGVIRVPLKKVT